jgi:acyl carrier protein
MVIAVMDIPALVNEQVGVTEVKDPLVLHLLSVTLKALAESRACTPEDLDSEWQAGGGNIEIDSLEAIFVFAALERALGHTLPGIEDLPSEEILSIKAIVSFVSRHLSSIESDGSSNGAAEK